MILRRLLDRLLERTGLAIISGRPRRVGNDGLTDEEREHYLAEFDRIMGTKTPRHPR